VYEGTGTRFKLIQFGQVSIWYEHSSKKFRFYTTDASTTTNIYVYQTGEVYGTPVYTSGTLNIQTQKWLPVNFRIFLNSSTGIIAMSVDGSNISYTGNTAVGSSFASDLYIYGGGSINNVSSNFRGSWGYPTLLIDDIAVNNSISAFNSTGSYGVSDTSYPPYISCQLAEYTSTGSNTIGWMSTVPLQTAMTQSGTYGTASFYPRPELYLTPSNDFPSATTVEGINYYISGAYREGSSDVYIFPQFTSESLSIQGMIGTKLATAEISSSVSMFEKDLGGKLSYSDYINGSITLKSSRWINQNFFGRGSLGNVRYSSNTNLGDSTDNGDYVIMEYNNLIIDSGVTVTTAARKKGLIIYVRENCIINGTLSMQGKSPVGLPNLTNGFVLTRNTSSGHFHEASSIQNPLHTLTDEQTFQPYSTSSINFDIPPFYSAGGNIQGAGQGSDGITRMCGGGGGGGQYGGPGGASTSYGGGFGGNGATGQPNGGGVIYLIVGKFLYISSSGKIDVSGINSTYPGGSVTVSGGSGGGAMVILYGKNFTNSGSLLATGGSGANGYYGSSAPGGNGTVRVAKIITN
jgi:hypothetical protein